MKTNRHEVAYLLGICALALVALTCNGDNSEDSVECPTGGSPTWTIGCDEFRTLSQQVAKNGEPHTASGCHPLVAGDTLTTDAAGEAELSLNDCPHGHVYLFRDSNLEFRMENCNQAQYGTSGYCNPRGTWYVSDCADEFTIWTGSAHIEKIGSTFSVTHIDEPSETTLLVVLEGSVAITPVLSVGPTTEFGPGADVPAGKFYFTTPGPAPAYLAGLEPRMVHPVSMLAPVAKELGLTGWMDDVRSRAKDDEILPYTWPEDLGGPVLPQNSLVVTLDGAPLQDPDAMDGLLLAVNWQAVLAEAGGSRSGIVLARLPDGWSFPVQDWTYDLDKALDLLEGAGYDRRQLVVILYPVADEPMASAAKAVAAFLDEAAIESSIQYAKPGELQDMITRHVKAGYPLLILSR